VGPDFVLFHKGHKPFSLITFRVYGLAPLLGRHRFLSAHSSRFTARGSASMRANRGRHVNDCLFGDTKRHE
jgi:hypothetical protein